MPYYSLCFDHCIINLPIDGIQFLSIFFGLFKNASPYIWRKDPKDEQTLKLPWIHVYGFTEETDRDRAVEEFRNRIRKAIKYPILKEGEIYYSKRIRGISETK